MTVTKIIAKEVSDLKELGKIFIEKATKLEKELGLFQALTPPRGKSLTRQQTLELIAKRQKTITKNKDKQK